jgi:hypothetical protein
MSSGLQLVDAFFSAATANDRTRASAMLADDVTFEKNATPTQCGADATLETMLTANGKLIARLRWEPAEAAGDVIRVTGHAPEGSAKLGYIMTVALRDGRITSIQQQDIRDARIAGSVRTGQKHDPICLPDELKTMINSARDTNPMAIAAVDEHGQPLISNRGSIHAFSNDQLALWIRNPEGDLVTAIARNPRVALLYREQTKKATFQFQGSARVSRDAAERERVFAATPASEQKHDFARIGAAVIIDLDLVEGYFSLEPGAQKLSQRRHQRVAAARPAHTTAGV